MWVIWIKRAEKVFTDIEIDNIVSEIKDMAWFDLSTNSGVRARAAFREYSGRKYTFKNYAICSLFLCLIRERYGYAEKHAIRGRKILHKRWHIALTWRQAIGCLKKTKDMFWVSIVTRPQVQGVILAKIDALIHSIKQLERVDTFPNQYDKSDQFWNDMYFWGRDKLELVHEFQSGVYQVISGDVERNNHVFYRMICDIIRNCLTCDSNTAKDVTDYLQIVDHIVFRKNNYKDVNNT